MMFGVDVGYWYYIPAGRTVKKQPTSSYGKNLICQINTRKLDEINFNMIFLLILSVISTFLVGFSIYHCSHMYIFIILDVPQSILYLVIKSSYSQFCPMSSKLKLFLTVISLTSLIQIAYMNHLNS